MERVPTAPLEGLRAMQAYDRAALEAHVGELQGEAERLRAALGAERRRRVAAEAQLTAAASLGDTLGDLVLMRQHEIAKRREANRAEVDAILADARAEAVRIRAQAVDDAVALRAAFDEISASAGLLAAGDGEIIDLSTPAAAPVEAS